ncbi:MAG: ttuB [Gemmataceae bacterium]|nr:ttuB [Gemmataceae bacterium]
MPDLTGPTPPESDGVARSARRKVALRVLPLLLLMYVISYLDRVNAGFAKLQMQKDLEFSDQVFGWGFGLFFVGYLLLEIPGALLVEHWSARKWFARILVTWGVCSMGMALVRTPEQFYLARFLLGLAEAGFFPGVIVYFTHWFPRQYRAKAFAGMLLAVPASQALGAYASALLLKQDWYGLAGWQWVFVVEGAPAVLLGVVVPFLLPDRPRDVNWLSPAEKEWLEQTLEAERNEAAASRSMPLRDVLRLRTVWFLALGILATNLGGIGMVFWLPTVVKGFLGKTDVAADDSQVLLWTGAVFLCGLLGVLASGWSSDRTGDRKWHCIAGQIGTGTCLAASAIPGLPWPVVFTWLCLAGFFANFWFSPYWVLPTLTLTSSAAAVAIGVINMCANIPGFISNYVLGWMKDAGWPDSARLLFLAGGFILGGAFVSLVRVRKPAPAPDPLPRTK